MKILAIILFFASLALPGRAQTTIARDTSCSFLKNLRYKNGVDTVVISGTVVASVRLPPFSMYEERFLRKRGVDINKIGSSIEFRPGNCSGSFLMPLMVHADKGNFLDHYNGKRIKLTCVVFQGYAGNKDHSPYVLVLRAVPEKS